MVFRKEPADNVTPPIANNQNGEFESPHSRKKRSQHITVTAFSALSLEKHYHTCLPSKKGRWLADKRKT